ncbi:DUF397 domain-containing protein [Streptomyces ziwulingensis]|uniref:DUF397 domain-containing protein n=1 Tax=Streptomyces ziwulingensis TaxID=1045501 RepID=A0ABP9AI48_9ACTN
MSSIFNGISAGELAGACWIKASRSDGVGECVELAEVGENVALRNSRDPEGPALIFTRSELSAFIDGAAKGEFRQLAG